MINGCNVVFSGKRRTPGLAFEFHRIATGQSANVGVRRW
jgi:hypothetical protein